MNEKLKDISDTVARDQVEKDIEHGCIFEPPTGAIRTCGHPFFVFPFPFFFVLDPLCFFHYLFLFLSSTKKSYERSRVAWADAEPALLVSYCLTPRGGA